MTLLPLNDGYATVLCRGIAVELNSWGIGTYVQGAAIDASTPRPVIIGLPEPQVEQLGIEERIVIAPLSPSTAYRRASTTPVVFNYRTDPDGTEQQAQNFIDLLRRRLNNLAHYSFGTIRVGRVTFGSHGTLGPDPQRRQQASATYLFRGFNPDVNT